MSSQWELLTAHIHKNSTYKRKITDFKIIDNANCKTCKKLLLAAECAILVRYYDETAKERALYESTEGSAVGPADKPPN